MPLLDQVRGAYTDARVASVVLSCAAVLGLLLRAIGLYGVVSYDVSQRTQYATLGGLQQLNGLPRSKN
jgi:hypothetical protein